MKVEYFGAKAFIFLCKIAKRKDQESWLIFLNNFFFERLQKVLNFDKNKEIQ